MPTITKIWAFQADVESWDLTQLPTPAFTLTHEAGDGSPSSGCLKLSNSAVPGAASQGFESPLLTWEQLGVPPLAEVLTVRLQFQERTIDSAPGQTISAVLLDETQTDILDGDLFNTTALPGVGGWNDMGAGPLRNVDFLAQESTQQVQVKFIFTRSANEALEFRFDTITLTITYDDGGGDSVAVPIQNLDGLVFMKGFAYASRIGGTPDAIGMAALQECSLSHGYSTAEARGPESLQPLGVGITEETLTGSIRYMVCTAEQFQVFIGGTISYNGGTGKTTWVKKVNEEPSGFNLHLKTPEDGTDLEVYVYNCLATNQPIIEGGANREFKTFGVDFRAYGQTPAQGGKLIETIHPGNQTSAS